MLSNIAFSLLLMGPMEHAGLALANAMASIVNFSLLFLFLRKKLKHIETRKIVRSFSKILAASVLMGIAARIMLHGELWRMDGRAAEKTLFFTGAMLICIGLYLALSFIFKSEEIGYIYETVKQRFRKG